MEIYPRILTDDGMGYGVDENVIVSVDIDSQNEYINIFRERKPTDEEQEELSQRAATLRCPLEQLVRDLLIPK